MNSLELSTVGHAARMGHCALQDIVLQNLRQFLRRESGELASLECLLIVFRAIDQKLGTSGISIREKLTTTRITYKVMFASVASSAKSAS